MANEKWDVDTSIQSWMLAWNLQEALLSCDIVESNSKAECKDSTYGVDQNNELQELLAAPYWFDVLPAEEKTKRTADSL